MKLILFLSNFLLFICRVCEDFKRPKKKDDCFGRTFVGEYNESNAYCCYFYFEKFNWPIYKCSLHFKDEIDNDAVYSTMDFLKNINSQIEREEGEEETNEIKIISFDCKSKYILIKNIYIFIVILLLIYL